MISVESPSSYEFIDGTAYDMTGSSTIPLPRREADDTSHIICKNRNEGYLLSSPTLLVGSERGRIDFVPGASIDSIDIADE